MLLDVSKIGAHERFERSVEPQGFDCRGEEYAVVADVRLGLEIHKVREKLRLVGTLATTLELRCSRCLEAFPRPVDVSFDLVYLPQEQNRGEGEIEVQADDLAAAFYRNDEIDLGQLMREQFYLALPMKPLCREECRGLCPECGANLNVAACDCVHRWEDPRLAGLKTLLKDE